MANYVDPKRADFFQEFYKLCVPKGQPARNFVIEHGSIPKFYDGFSVQPRHRSLISRLIRWLIAPFVTTDQEKNLAKLRTLATVRMQRFEAVSGADSREDKQQLADELLALAKSCSLLQGIAKQMSPCWTHAPLYEMKRAFKQTRASAVEKAAALLGKSFYQLALEHSFIKEAAVTALKSGVPKDARHLTRLHASSLLSVVMKTGNMPLIFELIALGADCTHVGMTKEALFKKALDARHIPACKTLMQSFTPHALSECIKTMLRRDDLTYLEIAEMSSARRERHTKDRLEACKTCQFCKKLLKELGSDRTTAALQSYLKTQSLALIRHVAALSKTKPFYAALKNGLIKEALGFKPTKVELQEAYSYYPALMQMAHKKQQMPLVLDLIGLGANPKGINVTHEVLIKESIKQKHREACLKLASDVAAGALLAIFKESVFQRQTAAVLPMDRAAAISFIHSVLVELNHASFNEFKEYCSSQILTCIQEEAKRLNQTPFQVAVANEYFTEAVDCSPSVDELKRAKAYYAVLFKAAYVKKKMDLVLDLISCGASFSLPFVDVKELFFRALAKQHHSACVAIACLHNEATLVLDYMKIEVRSLMPLESASSERLSAGFVTACKTCHFLQHVLKETYKLRRVPSYHEYKESLKKERLEIIRQAAKRLHVTPLQFALQHSLFAEAVGLKPTRQELAIGRDHFKTLLDGAVKKKDHRLIIDLMMLGADISSLSITKDALLLAAYKAGYEDACIKLIELGATHTTLFHGPDYKQATWLHFAASNGYKKFAQVLVRKGLHIDVQDQDGNTPLHFACRARNSEMADWLLEKGADPTRENHHKVLPLLAPVASARFSHQQKEFYREFFVAYEPICHALDGVASFKRWLESLAGQASMIVENAQAHNVNPLRVPFLLRDALLAKQMAACLSRSQFTAYVEQLAKSFPRAELAFIETAPYLLNEAHFKKGVLDLDVEPPAKDVSIKHLLTLLTYMDGDDKEAISKGITEMIRKVNAREAFLGTPRAGSEALKEFYQTIQYALQNLILKLEEQRVASSPKFQPTLQEVMRELKRASGYCGGQYRTAPVLLYLKVCKNISLSKEDKMYGTFADCRGLLAEGLFSSDRQGVHSFGNFVRKRGEKLGIPGYKMMTSFEDSYIGERSNVDELEQELRALYLLKIKDWILPRILDSELRDEFIDWQKEHVPAGWEKERFDTYSKTVKEMQARHALREEIVGFLHTKEIELEEGQSFEQAIRSEQIASYFNAYVYNMETGKPNASAIWDMLVGLGILQSCFIEHNGPHEYVKLAADIGPEVPQGWLARFKNYLSSFYYTV